MMMMMTLSSKVHLAATVFRCRPNLRLASFFRQYRLPQRCFINLGYHRILEKNIGNNFSPKKCRTSIHNCLVTINHHHQPDQSRKPAKMFSTTSNTQANKILTFPNVLCMGRMAITPLIAYLILNDHFEMALMATLVCSSTDFVDGWFARKFNAQSKLGAILDPLADKLLVVTLTITLTYVHLFPLWLTALIYTRDLLIISGGFYMRYKELPKPITLRQYFDFSTFSKERFQPTLLSKINTGFQLSLVLLSLCTPIFMEFFQNHQILLPTIQMTTGLTTLTSGLWYLKRL